MSSIKRLEMVADLEVAQFLKNMIEVIPNTKSTYGNKKYIIRVRPDVIYDDALAEIIKQWVEYGKGNQKEILNNG